MDTIIGLGKAGCAIADKFAEYPQYKIFKIDSEGLDPKRKNCHLLKKQDSPEKYEKATRTMKTFFSKTTDDILFVLSGSGIISGASLQVLKNLKDKNVNNRWSEYRDGSDKYVLKEIMIDSLRDRRRVFFIKDDKGKDFYCTFRGERGAVEFAKAYFTPKKIAIENVQNAVQSPFMKAVQKLNDVQTGVIGTANTLTNVAKSEQNKGGNMDKRLINEVDQIVNSAEKFIDLLYNNNHPYAQKKLFGLYAYIVDCLEDDNFQQYISGISKAKISFQEIQINKKPFNIIEGDFNKYIANIR